MRGLSLAFNRSDVSYNTFWGFDSFMGFPDESNATVRSAISARSWQTGDYNVAALLGEHSYASLEARLRRYKIT